MGAAVTTVDEFVHLHLHTQYSLLDGAIRVPELIARCKEYGMKTVAITDHGNMFGAIEFYDYAKKNEIKPIIGVEAYIAPGSRFEKKGRPDEAANHLTLIALDHTGYKNLCRLVSHAYLEGFHYRPRMDKELLAKHHEGILCLSGCLKGEVAQKFTMGDDAGAIAAAKWYQDLFGKENYALEVMENGLDEQRLVNEKLFKLSKEIDAPVVATGDCHYLRREDAPAHDALLCIGTGKLLAEPNRMKFNNDGYYLKSPSEMAKEWRHYPEAVKNSLAIAEKAALKFDFGKYHFPIYPGSTEPGAPTLDELMAQAARQGLASRMTGIRQFWKGRKPAKGETAPTEDELEDRYAKRLEYEIGIIQKMGFSGYLLIVADFINWAKNNGVPVGPGRGSAAGSLVCYAMKITDIDPIPYNLLFERFLNPERVSMPDIDVDFCINGRGRVIDYVNGRYGGSEYVSQIITFGQMKAKAVIRDIGRVMGLSFADTDRIAKLIPNTLNITLDQAIEQAPALRELVSKDPTVQQVMQMAKGLEGLTRHASVHAAGVVISDKPLTEYLPLFRGKEGETVTQFDMKWVEKVGLIKFDFLGLKNLTMIEDAVRRVKAGKGVELRMDELDMDDEKVYALLSSGDADGIFQLESSGMRELLSKLKPTMFEDVAALVALYRPGPLQSGMVDDYVERKHGRTPVVYPLPELEPILRPTYGTMIYQEQVMRIAQVLSGYSLGEADLLRRAMGKKNLAEMAKQQARFVEGAVANGHPREAAVGIFDDMAKFAAYGFNKSHSAAYGYIAYQTAYLKAHYRPEFMAALMTIEAASTDKVMTYILDCRKAGIHILPVDVNTSEPAFSVPKGEHAIRFGLSAVRNVGAASIEAIVEARRAAGGAFRSIGDFFERVDSKRVNRRVFECLIKAGALDFAGVPRAALIEGLDAAIVIGARAQEDKARGQTSLFGARASATIRFPDVPEWPLSQKLAFEKEVLGLYLSGHPMQAHGADVLRYAGRPISRLAEAANLEEARAIGLVVDTRVVKTRRNDKMAFVRLEDADGAVECVFFAEAWARSQRAIDQAFEANQPVLVTGKLEVRQGAARELGGVESDEIKLLASSAEPLSEVRARTTREVRFSLEARDLQGDRLDRFLAVLQAQRGSCRSRLIVRVPGRFDAELGLPQLPVEPSTTMEESVIALFGRSVVELC